MTIQEIAEQIRTQDNRITDQPIFIVERKVRDCGFEIEYADDFEWFHPGKQTTADERQARILNKMVEAGRDTGDWRHVGYKDRWEFVTACFTEQGCKDFIKRDGHNHGETRIYAVGSYRNEEYRLVRNMLLIGALSCP